MLLQEVSVAPDKLSLTSGSQHVWAWIQLSSGFRTCIIMIMLLHTGSQTNHGFIRSKIVYWIMLVRSWVTTYPHHSMYVPTVIFKRLHQTQTRCLVCIRTLPCSEIQTIIMVPKMMAIRTSCFFFAHGMTSRSTFLGRCQPLSGEKQGWTKTPQTLQCTKSCSNFWANFNPLAAKQRCRGKSLVGAGDSVQTFSRSENLEA